MTTELIPAGTYRARATEAQLGETSKGAEQVAIGFQVLTPGFESYRLAYYGTFGEKALPITVKALRACGWQGIDLADLAGIDTNEVNLVVEHEEYPVGSGSWTAKVKWVNDGNGGMLKNVLDPQAAKSFAQRMRGAIAGIDAGQPKTAAPATQQRPPQRVPVQNFDRRPEPPPVGDDIPF